MEWVFRVKRRNMMTKKREKIPLVLATIAIIIATLLLWYAATVFLIGFAAILWAIFLQTVSHKLSKRLKIPYSLTLLLVVIVLIVLMAILFVVSTPLISKQLSELFLQLPQSYEQFKTFIGQYTHGKFLGDGNLTDELIFKNEKFFKQASAIFSFTFDVVTSFSIFILIGIYLAFDPDRYIKGSLLLIPKRNRTYAAGVISELGNALRWWLFGKGISMAAIGILTMVGLWILNVPLAFILGLLAALFAFIPYIGSIISAIPAILVALAVSPTLALYATLLYLIVHAIEGYFITPFIEQRTVSIPPALTVFVQVVLTLLVGFLGLALTSPLIVVMLVLVRELYIKKQSTQ
jgi:predicted PurR-regulated permease PerM